MEAHPLKKISLGILTLTLLIACSGWSEGGAVSASPQAAELEQFATQCDNGPKERGFPRFARLEHDPQWMEYPSRMAAPDWPRGFYFDWYPQTVQLWANPRSGDGRLPYSRAWLEYLRDLQPDAATATWITRISAGLFNSDGNEFIPIHDLDSLKEQPVAESISAGGNVVKVLETHNGSARLEMLFLRDEPPSTAEINYELTPWLVTKFTSISIDGELGNAGGIDTYFPNLSKDTDGYWVDLARVEWFPLLPLCAIAEQDLRVRNLPPSSGLTKQIGVIPQGSEFTVREYLPQASDVWARTDEGWVLLQYLNAGGVPVFTTSWEMETRPPILFP